MSFEKIAADRIRSAEQQEILGGESGLIVDIADVFTSERMNNGGIFVDFGDNRDAFVMTLETLGIQEAFKRDSLHINDMSVGGGGSTSHCAASLGEWAANAPSIISTLEYMQVLQWSSEKKEGWNQPVVGRSGAISSRISALSLKEGEAGGDRVIDLDKPMVIIQATYTYEPGVFNCDTYETFNLREFLQANYDPRGNNNTLPVKLSEQVEEDFFDDEKVTLLPSGSYSLVIGRPKFQRDILLGVVEPAYPQHGYFVRNGRLYEAVEPTDD